MSPDVPLMFLGVAGVVAGFIAVGVVIGIRMAERHFNRLWVQGPCP